MNPEVKKKWLEALRSGEYKQGIGALRNTNASKGIVTHCCLGVLCDIHSKETKTEWSFVRSLEKYFGNSATLPEEVQRWSEIETIIQYKNLFC